MAVSPERQDAFTTVERQGRVAIVRFDRGDGLNALSIAAMRELTEVARRLHEDPETSAVVLTGTPEIFSAGADLKDPALSDRDASGLLRRRHLLRTGPDLCRAWEELEQITIAAIEGPCIGGGVALAATFDHRIAGGSAHFRLPEVPLGMNMSWQSNPRLLSLMGPPRTKRFVILGEKLDADSAAEWGLVDETVAERGALSAAIALAERYAALPPVAVRMSKQGISAAANALHHSVSFMDRDQFGFSATGKDQREAISAFLEKRKPKFTGD